MNLKIKKKKERAFPDEGTNLPIVIDSGTPRSLEFGIHSVPSERRGRVRGEADRSSSQKDPKRNELRPVIRPASRFC